MFSRKIREVKQGRYTLHLRVLHVRCSRDNRSNDIRTMQDPDGAPVDGLT